jgi:hypothetical protein
METPHLADSPSEMCSYIVRAAYIEEVELQAFHRDDVAGQATRNGSRPRTLPPLRTLAKLLYLTLREGRPVLVSGVPPAIATLPFRITRSTSTTKTSLFTRKARCK